MQNHERTPYHMPHDDVDRRLPMDHRPVALKLESATSYEDDTVWLRYSFNR